MTGTYPLMFGYSLGLLNSLFSFSYYWPHTLLLLILFFLFSALINSVTFAQPHCSSACSVPTPPMMIKKSSTLLRDSHIAPSVSDKDNDVEHVSEEWCINGSFQSDGGLILSPFITSPFSSMLSTTCRANVPCQTNLNIAQCFQISYMSTNHNLMSTALRLCYYSCNDMDVALCCVMINRFMWMHTQYS